MAFVTGIYIKPDN